MNKSLRKIPTLALSYPFLTIGIDIAKGGSSSETLERNIERQAIIMVSTNSEIEKPLFLDKEKSGKSLVEIHFYTVLFLLFTHMEIL